MSQSQEISTKQVNETQHEQFLTLFLTSETEALLPTEQMVEIVTLEASQILSIPDTLDEVMGVFNWRQQITWLVDLPHLLWLTPLYEQRVIKHNVIVIKNQEQKIGIAVYEIGQIIRDQPEGTNYIVLEAETIMKLVQR